jgi:hypothetical protein
MTEGRDRGREGRTCHSALLHITRTKDVQCIQFHPQCPTSLLSLELRRGRGRPGGDLSADAPDEVRDEDVEFLGGEELREGGREGSKRNVV